MSAKATAVTRVGTAAWKWFSESSRSGTVVLGNHPYSVRRIEGKREGIGVNSRNMAISVR